MIAFFAMVGRILLLGFERIGFKNAGEDRDPFVSTFLLFMVSCLLLSPILFFVQVSFQAFSIAFISGFIYTITFTLYVYILSQYEISLVTPFYNFNTLFLLILSIIFLGESFSLFKLFGIFLLIFGISFLDRKQNIIESYKAILKNRGCQLMSLVSLLVAVGRVFDTYFVREDINPLFYSFAINVMISVYLGIFLIISRKISQVPSALKERPKHFLLGGIYNAYSYSLLLVALLYIDISIAEPLSMLSVIVSILLSSIFFKEKIKNRFIGAFIMFLGAILLIFQI
ncbi:MAG: EamA family transporter [archaeon]|nr:EamA family transporter [archaeon]